MIKKVGLCDLRMVKHHEISKDRPLVSVSVGRKQVKCRGLDGLDAFMQIASLSAEVLSRFTNKPAHQITFKEALSIMEQMTKEKKL